MRKNREFLVPEGRPASKSSMDEAFGARVGAHRTIISRIRRNKQKPNWPLMKRIIEVTCGEVTPNDFLDEADVTTVADRPAEAA